MNTKLTNKQIKNLFNSVLTPKDEKSDIEHLEKMIMVQFLSEIEKIMKEEGLNKKQFAAKIKTSPSYITQVFQGDKIINLQFLARVKKAFNISYDISIKREDDIVVLVEFKNSGTISTLESMNLVSSHIQGGSETKVIAIDSYNYSDKMALLG